MLSLLLAFTYFLLYLSFTKKKNYTKQTKISPPRHLGYGQNETFHEICQQLLKTVW